jgi:hypothetical protein
LFSCGQALFEAQRLFEFSFQQEYFPNLGKQKRFGVLLSESAICVWGIPEAFMGKLRHLVL